MTTRMVRFSSLFISLVVHLTFDSAFAGPTQWSPRIGSPVYVLEQADRPTSEHEFEIWELRPSEKVAHLENSGSRLIFSGQGPRVKSFGLVGFQISKTGIHPGTIIVLDTQGDLWWMPAESHVRTESSTPWTRIIGRYLHLEQDADQKLFAINVHQQVVEIDSEIASESGRGKAPAVYSDLTDVLASGEKATQLRVDANNSLLIFTSRFLELSPTDKKPKAVAGLEDRTFSNKVKFYRDGHALWVVDPTLETLIRYPLGSQEKEIQTLSLTPYFEEGRQNSREVQIFGGDNDALIVRIGAHVYEFSKTVFGKTLTHRILGIEFMANEIRDAGVNFGLHRSLIAVQPRTADRTGNVRKDIDYAANYSRDVKEGVEPKAGPENSQDRPEPPPAATQSKADTSYHAMSSGGSPRFRAALFDSASRDSAPPPAAQDSPAIDNTKSEAPKPVSISRREWTKRNSCDKGLNPP